MVSTWDINNKRVKSLHINNKEVQSMVRVSDSAILYQKPTNYVLTLTSDKDILSYVDQESATLTATLKNGSTPMANEPIIFSIGSTSEALTSNNGHVTVVTGTPSYSSSGVYLDSVTAYVNSVEMDIVNNSYHIEFDAVKGSNGCYYGGGIVDDTGTPEYSTGVFISENDPSFCDQSFTLPSGLGSTIHVAMDWTPSTRKLYIDGSLVSTVTGTIPSEFYYYNYFGLWSSSYIGDFTVKNLVISDAIERTTDANGEATVSYLGKHTGSIYIKAICDNLNDTVNIEDCWRFDPATSNKTSSYASTIQLRNSGTGSITYDSNGYYILTPTHTDSDCFIPLNELTGLDDIVIEFDGYFPQNSSFSGFVIYSDNNNWIRLGTTYFQQGVGKNVNGTYNETNANISSSIQTWYHYKITITNNTFKMEMLNGSATIFSRTENVDSNWFTSSTKYGLEILWSTNWNFRIKNIKVKPL